MNPSDLDKIVDKLLVFRGRLPRSEDYNFTWWQQTCVDETLMTIDGLIKTLDALGEAFK